MSKLDAQNLPRNSEESPRRNYVVARIALSSAPANNNCQIM